MTAAFIRRSLVVLILVGLAAPAFAHDGNVGLTVQGDSLDRTVFTFHVDGFEQTPVDINGEEYLYINAGDAPSLFMEGVGHPQLPVFCNSVMIPDTARMKANILEAEYRDYEDVNIVPWKGNITRDVNPATVPFRFGEVYTKDAWFPGDVTHLRDPYILRDVRGQVVEVRPFQYNPVQKVLRVYTHLVVEVKADGEAGKNILDRSKTPARPDRSFWNLYSKQFVNFGAGDRGDPPDEDGDMLIISHGPFMAAMQPFVDWKNSIGINTSIVDVATIGNNATAIKNYITNIYNTSDLAFVLLVGDANEVKSGTYSWGASDAHYSIMTPDKYPDLFVGRFSANTTAHVDTQVQRTIEYEQMGHDLAMGGWNTYGMGVASNQGAGAGHYGESDDQHEDLIRDELLAYGFAKVDRIYDYFGTKTMVKNGLEEGRRCVHYTGHGWTQGWGSTGFDNNDVNKLTNVGMLPFISSVACNNGTFSGGTCFAEAWMRATHNNEPTGAIACYMSSVGQSWAPPMYGQGNHTKQGKYGGAERFWMETQWSIAGEWYGGGCCMMDLAGGTGQQEFMNWILFGDPSLRVLGSAGTQTLVADGSIVPCDTPVSITFTVQPGATYAGNLYLLLGSVSGTTPGTTIPGGVTVPLNFDTFTNLVIANANTPVFHNFYGTLDGQGTADAVFSTNGLTPINPHLAGLKMYFAAVVWPAGQPYAFATNAKMLTIKDV